MVLDLSICMQDDNVRVPLCKDEFLAQSKIDLMSIKSLCGNRRGTSIPLLEDRTVYIQYSTHEHGPVEHHRNSPLYHLPT